MKPILDLQTLKKQAKEMATRLFGQNKDEKSLKDYLSLAAGHPDDMRVKQKIAETYFKLRNVPQAVQIYRDIAQTYEEQNFILKAVAVYKNILKIDPILIDVNLKLAELYLKLEMNADAANQYRIAMQMLLTRGEKDELLKISQKLLEVEPTAANRRRLAETYQWMGLVKEALEQYEMLAQAYRMNKQYDELLRIYEMILPQKPSNQTMIRDVCILYLRKQQPDTAIRTMERYKVDGEASFTELLNKAKLMQKALRSPTK